MKIAIAWLLLLLPVSQCFAERLPVIQTIANRIPQPENAALASVTVLNEEDIAGSSATSLPDLLQAIPGISVASTGGPGQPASIFLRGTESDHTLILVDGIRLSSVSDGATALHFLPLSQIKRIEIVRGPRSGLYGSEAIGGVINISTKQAHGNQFSGQVQAGSFTTTEGSLKFGWQHRESSLSLQLSAQESDGINATETGNPDKDGFENTAISGQFSQSINDALQLNLSLLHSRGSNDFDDPFSATTHEESDFIQQTVNLQLLAMPTENIDLSLALGQSRDELDINSHFFGYFNSHIDQISTQLNYTYDKQTVSAGVDYRDENLNSSNNYDQSERENSGIFISWSGQYQRHHLNMSLRQDNNEAYGNHDTGNIDYGFDMTDRLRLTTSYATGFKSPSFNDLYFPASDFYQPNPDLSPEQSESFELGLHATIAQSVLKLNAYTTDIDNMISFTADPVTLIGSVDNIKSAKIEGVELNLQTALFGTDVNAGITHINARDKSSDEKLIRRPDTTASLAVSKTINHLSVMLQYLYNSSREDLDFNNFPATRVKLDGYSLLNINLQYQLSSDWSMFFKLNNLLDENYQTINSYNQPGINAFLGVQFQPAGYKRNK